MDSIVFEEAVLYLVVALNCCSYDIRSNGLMIDLDVDTCSDCDQMVFYILWEPLMFMQYVPIGCIAFYTC